MTKLLAAVIIGLFAVAGTRSPKTRRAMRKKPYRRECKKAMEAKKELAACEKDRKKGNEEVIAIAFHERRPIACLFGCCGNQCTQQQCRRQSDQSARCRRLSLFFSLR